MKCPNCQGEIGRFELSPDCKHCGANIFYCQQKKLLTDDAKKCELEYATYRSLVAKLTTAFIGGPVQILRIVAMLLAIGAIFIPFGSVGVDLSLISGSFSFGAWGVYSGFTNGTIGAMLSLIDYVPAQTGVSLALLGLMVVIFLVGFVVFLALLLSFIKIQRSAGIMRGLSVTGGILSIIALGVSLALPSVCAESAFITG